MSLFNLYAVICYSLHIYCIKCREIFIISWWPGRRYRSYHSRGGKPVSGSSVCGLRYIQYSKPVVMQYEAAVYPACFGVTALDLCIRPRI